MIGVVALKRENKGASKLHGFTLVAVYTQTNSSERWNKVKILVA